MSIIIQNHALFADGVKIQDLPAWPVDATVVVWTVPTDYVSSGYFVDAALPGQPRALPACALSGAARIATLTLPASDVAVVEQARAERLAAANAAAETMLSQLDATYPTREVLTWDQQVKEAEGVLAGGGAAATLLQSLAATRGIDVPDLADRVLTKSALYKAASGAIMGARQWVEDQLSEAGTIDDVLLVPTVEQRLGAIEATQQ